MPKNVRPQMAQMVRPQMALNATVDGSKVFDNIADGAEVLDDIADGAKVFDNTTDAVKVADKAADATRVAKKFLLPQNDSQIKHIFGNRTGHLPDTPYNRKLLIDTANTPGYYRGTDKYGNQWHVQIDSEGRQIWTRSQKGTINEGGRNDVPLPWDNETGLYQNPLKRK